MASRPCTLVAFASYRALILPVRTIAHRTAAPFSTTSLQCAKQRSRTPNKKEKYKSKAEVAAEKRKARATKRTHFLTEDLTHQVKYSLCDAMRIIRALEVGYPLNSPKYDLAIKLSTPINGPVLRNRLSLPHPVRTDLRVCVICPEVMAARALASGAAVAGLESVIELVKAGSIEFDACIAHESVLARLQKSGVARILGPKRLMPNVKDKTVVSNVVAAIREMTSGAEYRERVGVVRMAVGQIGFTPEQVSQNIQAFMGSVKKDISTLSDKVVKDIHEVVLSSTHGPGLSLNGEFVSTDGIQAQELIEDA